MKLAEIMTEDHAQKVIAHNRKARKKITGYGQLGTKYSKNPKYRDRPRDNKVRNYD